MTADLSCMIILAAAVLTSQYESPRYQPLSTVCLHCSLPLRQDRNEPSVSDVSDGACKTSVLMLQAASGQHVAPAVLQTLTSLEGKLTWLVYIGGALVGGYSWSDASSQDGEEAIDARCAHCFTTSLALETCRRQIAAMFPTWPHLLDVATALACVHIAACAWRVAAGGGREAPAEQQ